MALRRSRLAAFAFAAAGVAGAGAAAQQNAGAADSALFVYRFIVNRLAFFEQCAQTDRPNLAAYADAFRASSQETTPIADRAYAILREEAARAGTSPDRFAQRMFDIGRETRARLVEMAKDNPIAFTIGCRAVPRLIQERRQGFKPIPELFPDQMRAIDEWR